jgi:hypothetical protein
VKSLFLAAVGCTLFLTACGSSGDDPKKAYADLVRSAQAGDGAYMYEALDQKYQEQVDSMIAMQTSHTETMSPEEKANWESMKGLKGKEAFAKMVSMNREMMTSSFKGDYEVLAVDSVVVLTVKHEGQSPNLMYMRMEGGKWRVTAAPAPPQPEMPQGHPPMPEGHPEMQSPNESAPQHPAPQQGDSGK